MHPPSTITALTWPTTASCLFVPNKTSGTTPAPWREAVLTQHTGVAYRCMNTRNMFHVYSHNCNVTFCVTIWCWHTIKDVLDGVSKAKQRLASSATGNALFSSLFCSHGCWSLRIYLGRPTFLVSGVLYAYATLEMTYRPFLINVVSTCIYNPKFHLNFICLVKCYIWSIASYGAKTWVLWKIDQKYPESFGMWYWKSMEMISWTDRVRNEVHLNAVKMSWKELNILCSYKQVLF
jgi:hypothetical protein